MPPLLVLLVLARVPLLGKTARKRFLPMATVHLDYVEGQLAQRPWFAGDDFTAADVMMSFPLEAAQARVADGVDRPATRAWLAKIHGRPAYQSALKRGGPYAYA